MDQTAAGGTAGTEALREALANLEHERQGLIIQLGEALLERCHENEALYQEHAAIVDAIARLDEGMLTVKTSIDLMGAFEVQQRTIEAAMSEASAAPVVAIDEEDTTPEPKEMTTCPACGAPVSTSDAFCMSCGEPLAGVLQPAVPTIAASEVDEQAPEQAAVEAEEPLVAWAAEDAAPAADDASEDLRCPACGAPVGADDVFCMSCGERIARETHVPAVPAVPATAPTPLNSCPACGAPVDAGDAFCMSCGTQLTRSAAPAAPVARRFCFECGKPLGATDQFCMWCGTPAPTSEE